MPNTGSCAICLDGASAVVVLAAVAVIAAVIAYREWRRAHLAEPPRELLD